jgi:hypothetical protein
MIPTPEEAALLELEEMIMRQKMAATSPRDRLMAIAHTGLLGPNPTLGQGPLPAPISAAIAARQRTANSQPAAPPQQLRPSASNAKTWIRGGKRRR